MFHEKRIGRQEVDSWMLWIMDSYDSGPVEEHMELRRFIIWNG